MRHLTERVIMLSIEKLILISLVGTVFCVVMIVTFGVYAWLAIIALTANVSILLLNVLIKIGRHLAEDDES